MNRTVRLGGKTVGPGRPCYVIAEIGANHNGDMSLARKMIAAAKDCGCDAVKFQLWGRHTAHTESYIQELNRRSRLGDVELTTPQLELRNVSEQLERFQCTRDQHAELKRYADSVGIDFASTALTESDVDFLVDLGVTFLKIASQDTDHPHFIRHVGGKGLPTILSTGLSTWGEIEAAVDCFESKRRDGLVLLHCVSLYPPKDEVINLAKMETLRRVFDVPVGYSDHSIGFSIPLAAVALGACVIEKHFTLDKKLPGWDHKVSADPGEMAIICREAGRVREAIGAPNRALTDDEVRKKDHFRRSIVSARRIGKGEVVTIDKLDFKRPGTGIKPYELNYVLNRKAKRDIAEDALMTWDDLS